MFRFYRSFSENIYTSTLNSQREAVAAEWAEDTVQHRMWVICELKSISIKLEYLQHVFCVLFQSSVREKMCSYIMGIDIGTTSVKVCLINSSNREVIHKNIKVGKCKLKINLLKVCSKMKIITHTQDLKDLIPAVAWILRHSFLKILGYIQNLRSSSKLSYSNFKVNW